VVNPEEIPNLIDGEDRPAASGDRLDKRRPADGTVLCRVARSGVDDAVAAVSAARRAQPAWADRTPVERGDLVRDIALALRGRREELSAVVADEIGKSPTLAVAETDAAVEMGFFVAGEGRRSYGNTMPASMPHRTVLTIRRPIGVAALLTSFNTPLPNVAWKAFPAMLCGNASVLKPSEHAPASAHLFARIAHDVGLPPGVLNVLQGKGDEAGAALVAQSCDLVSFTGSAEVGRAIQREAGLAKVCLELGGKNALVVCDDADLDAAVRWTVASAFSNAGQRCAAGSRVIVFAAVYERFRERLAAAVDALDPELVVSAESRERILAAVAKALDDGAAVVAGGVAAAGSGYAISPTVLEDVSPEAVISCTELFGPVTVLYRVGGLDEAIDLVNATPYGLTAAIHTASLHRAMRFSEQAQVGVVVVNGGTHGSEPHMGFGGVKQSGNGWKEAGMEAIEVYSAVRYVNLISDPSKT
jgi:acyl-CoA reductase-like NAD-dependent aldehyde dehydrogenase